MRTKYAMILAAGYGTRLKPITDKKPKALVEINGTPMLDMVIEKLLKSGIEHIVVNAHHFHEKILDHVNNSVYKNNIKVIIEDKILGTGGGIKNAASELKHSDNFFVYNVDVRSDIELEKLEEYHFQNGSLATLAVQSRYSSRPLIINEKRELIGNQLPDGRAKFYTDNYNEIELTGFTGIHIISNRIFDLFEQDDFFHIFKSYFNMIKAGNIVHTFNADKYKWMDLGTINDSFRYS